ncbi:MAG: asparagine synthase (glutamine-hydrolyzing) [Acidobacteriota bacterium]
MCGVAGVYDLGGGRPSESLIGRMVGQVAHRGPDGEGCFVDGPVALGHRRLAIIDLSMAGRQPITTEGGDVVVVHNGEIYNFKALRAELEAAGHRFSSQTDSEVIAHAYEEWGEQSVERFNGMFAFAVYDRRGRVTGGRLFLARDRYGIKPLYYAEAAGALVFASEVKALLQHPGVSVRVSPAALGEYFTFQNVFSDLTLFDGVRLLPPGSTLTVDAEAAQPIVQRRYWQYRCPPHSSTMSVEDAADEVFHRFERAVTRQLVSDVPVGAYLSGGMDSASIVSVATRDHPRLTTFTQGFDLSSASGLELGFDERRSAELLSNLLKTEHYEMVMHAGDMEWVLPTLVWHLEDLRVGQCYPNYYVARLASRFVKVVLSGAGGDELFGGYPWRYQRAAAVAGRDAFLAQYYGAWQRLVSDEDTGRLFTPEMHRGMKGRPFEVFRAVFDGWEGEFLTPDDSVNASLYFEFKTFLHGLLIVEDKLSMAHGLETRVPFLDDDLVDFALQLPPSLKLRSGGAHVTVDENAPGKRRLYEMQSGDGKLVLRQAMGRLIPPEITERAKQGFSAPDASWFRGESIDYIKTLVGDPRARLYEFLQPKFVREKLDEHTEGRANHRLFIWSLLSFEWWLRTFVDGKGARA